MNKAVAFIVAVLAIRLVSATLNGDVDGNRVVDLTDLQLLANEFGKISNFTNQVDLNQDNVINLFDVMIIVSNWGSHDCSLEVCDNTDNDCDGLVDEDACNYNYYCDQDQDQHISTQISGACNSYNCTPAICGNQSGDDCDDTNSLVYPSAEELCDGIDNDCNSSVDEQCFNQTQNQTLDGKRILIIYNSHWTADEDENGVQDSLQVAQYYAAKRSVPSQNILGISFDKVASEDHPISIDGDYNYLNQSIITPINEKLAELGPKNIDIILLSYQLPAKFWSAAVNQYISLDSTLVSPGYTAKTTPPNPWTIPSTYFEQTPEFGEDFGRFSHNITFYGKEFYLVSRLDGPGGVGRVLDLVDQALYAEKYLNKEYWMGTTYVDSQGAYTDEQLTADSLVINGVYTSSGQGADKNIAYSEHYVMQKGLPFKWEQTGGLIGDNGARYSTGEVAARAPNAILYGGWYPGNRYNGYDIFDWLPGSIGCSLDSYNLGYDFRNPYFPPWGIAALYDGLTAISGVVDEPYLSGHPRPNVLLYYILNGYTFSEAAALANPYIYWTTMNIGDPLYQPFKQKIAVKDLDVPEFVAGYPRVVQSNPIGTRIYVEVSDEKTPEAVNLTIEYGPTSSYGQKVNRPQFYKRHSTTIPDLQASTTYHYRVIVTDPAGNSKTSLDNTFTTPAQTPYRGVASPIPGRINFTEFDEGGEGIAYHDNDVKNYNPGYQPRKETAVEVLVDQNIAWVFMILLSPWHKSSDWDNREWLEYTVDVATSGNYQLQVYANPGSSSISHYEIDGEKVLDMNLSGPYGFTGLYNYSLHLDQGTHVLRWIADAGSDNNAGSFAWMNFTKTIN